MVFIKRQMQPVQTSSSQFIHLLSTPFSHAARWIRATSCSQIQHEKIQVNFLYSQPELKAVTSHWDQFITSMFVLLWPYCVKNGGHSRCVAFCDKLTASFLSSSLGLHLKSFSIHGTWTNLDSHNWVRQQFLAFMHRIPVWKCLFKHEMTHSRYFFFYSSQQHC